MTISEVLSVRSVATEASFAAAREWIRLGIAMAAMIKLIATASPQFDKRKPGLSFSHAF